MHRSIRLSIASVILLSSLSALSSAAQPGSVDFGKFAPAEKGEFVQINLGKGLIKFASFFARHEDPQAAELISNISHVRVNVVGLDEHNRAATTTRMTEIRQRLLDEGWEQIVAVQGNRDEDVAVFLKQHDGEVIQGIVVTVLDERKKEAVFVNVVGNIRADQIGAIGARLNVRQLASIK